MKQDSHSVFHGGAMLSSDAAHTPFAALKSQYSLAPARRDTRPGVSAGGARQRRRGRRPQF